MNTIRVSRKIGNEEISFETGRLAKQANGSVFAQTGGTVVLAAVVAAREPKEAQDFFPLTVDYRERTYAAGKIPGGYFKRETKPSEGEILISRLIDRPIRPLFPEEFLNEVQITVTALSSDLKNPTDVLSMNSVSAALCISDIPFERPVGAVRVGMIDGQLILNPTAEETLKGDLDLVLSGTEEKVIMIEAGCKEITEEQMFKAIHFGHEGIKQVIALQKELVSKVGSKEKMGIKAAAVSEDVRKKTLDAIGKGFDHVFNQKSKEAREEATRELFEKVLAAFDQEDPEFKKSAVKKIFEETEMTKVRNMILDENKRPDGRAMREIRPITCDVSVLPTTHGSGLFTRGQTQSLSVITLGTGDDEQTVDALEGEYSKRFMLHYNFPSFSVGEVKPNRGPGRREIGHGALAERSLFPVIPSQEEFPYVIRVVSEILESNGSSSMATVCAGTLSLLDAGVPIKAPVAGVALGLVTRDKAWKVVTDIAGIEDHLGDMDFKAAGTRKGLTALQMDLKIDGVTDDILKEAFDQAKEARMKILGMIENTINAPKALSQYAPRITVLKINPSKIGEIIGPGGKNIKKLVEETGVKIDIEDDGRVFIASADAEASEIAIARIKGVAEEVEIGKIYQATVRKLMAFGAFCEVLPGTDGLCHVSEVSEGFVKNVNDYLRVGDIVPVKVVGVDDNGKISLSIKQAKEGGMPVLPPDAERDPISESAPRGGRDRSRGRR